MTFRAGTVMMMSFVSAALAAAWLLTERLVQTQHLRYLARTQILAELVVILGLEVSQLLKTFKLCLG